MEIKKKNELLLHGQNEIYVDKKNIINYFLLIKDELSKAKTKLEKHYIIISAYIIH